MNEIFPYGFCPICGEPGVTRERHSNGNDTCRARHTYPSCTALHAYTGCDHSSFLPISDRSETPVSPLTQETHPDLHKRTPGPWHACGNGTCQCGMVHGENDLVATVTVGKWGDSDKGKLIYEYGEVAKETSTANARLIAAAPELLKICEQAQIEFQRIGQHFLSCPSSEDMGKYYMDKAKQMRDGINKAIEGDLEYEKYLSDKMAGIGL